MRKVPMVGQEMVWQEAVMPRKPRKLWGPEGFPVRLAKIVVVKEHKDDGTFEVEHTEVDGVEETTCSIFWDFTDRIWKHTCYKPKR